MNALTHLPRSAAGSDAAVLPLPPGDLAHGRGFIPAGSTTTLVAAIAVAGMWFAPAPYHYLAMAVVAALVFGLDEVSIRLGLRQHASRQQADRDRHHAELMTAACAASRDGMVICEERRIRQANPAFFRLTGIDPADLDGLPESWIEQQLREHCVGWAAPAAADGADPNEHRTWYFTVRGPRRILERSVRHCGNGSVHHFRDVRAELVERWSRAGSMVDATFELRQGLASVYGFSELLLERDFDEQTRRELVECIHRNCLDSVRVIESVFDDRESRPGAGTAA